MATYGFIGAGNMAGAIVRGAVAAGMPPCDLAVTSARSSAATLAQEVGVRLAASGPELVSTSAVVVLAVKPHVVPVVAAQVHDVVASHQPLVVSLAAGLSTARLEALLPTGTRVVRAMPNMAAAVGQSMTALTAGSRAKARDVEQVRSLTDLVGRTVVLEERDLPAFVSLASSSPAFVLTLIEALARGGLLEGMPKAQAVAIVTQAVLGTALMVQAEVDRRASTGSGRSPADLVDSVCSPGGTTVAGLVALERAGFSDALIRAVQATVARDRELGA